MTARLRDDCFALPPGIAWTPVDEALARLREGVSAVTAVEDVPLADAAGRVLARPALARRDNPPAANSAVDGYAFAWAALGGRDGAELPLEPGRSAAGSPFAGRLPDGHALRILTGAEIPCGADTVVLQEDTQVAAGRLRFRAPRKQGANTRKRGEDAAHGDAVLPAGRRLNAADLARLAVVGVDRVAVRAPLRVAVLSTGDELLQPGDDPGLPGIFDANRPMLAALAAGWGHGVVDLGAMPDRAEAIRDALDRGAA